MKSILTFILATFLLFPLQAQEKGKRLRDSI